MHCCYINLDHALDRRLAIEASFNQSARPGWRLERFSALTSAMVDADAVKGSRSRLEKACFLSHKAVIQAHAGSDRHLLVLEDDAAFGRTTCEVVDGFLQQNAEADWDLLFLDICPIRIEHMLSLYFNRETLIRERTVVPLDLEKLPFSGANAYIVNARSYEKVLSCMKLAITIDNEYDAFLSACIGQGLLKAAVLFPFVITLSRHAQASQIQRRTMDTANLARNVFRNMVWLESRPDDLQDAMRKLDEAVTGAGHANLAKVLTGICMTDGDPGFNSDPVADPVSP